MSREDIKLIPSRGKMLNSFNVGMCLELQKLEVKIRVSAKFQKT
jgi:hypothetical protein